MTAALGINIVIAVQGVITIKKAGAETTFLWLVLCLTTELLLDRYNGASIKLSTINTGDVLGKHVADRSSFACLLVLRANR